MAKKLFGKDWVSMEYLKRYPNSKRTEWWRSQKVNIRSDNGLWRKDAKGYVGNKKMAWSLPMADAVDQTWHCGPEKRVIYTLSEKYHKIELGDLPLSKDIMCFNYVTGWFRTRFNCLDPEEACLPFYNWGEHGKGGVWYPCVTEWKGAE